jgi:hypothetical protein
MKIYKGKHIEENRYLVLGEFAQLQIDSVVPIEIETGETVYGIVVTRTGGAAVVQV